MVSVYSGKKDLHLHVDVTPGFLTLGLTNLTGTSIGDVHVALFPAAGSAVQFSTRPHPFAIPPAGTTYVPIAYSSPEPAECQVMLLFLAGDSDILLCEDRVLLSRCDDPTHATVGAWRSLAPWLNRAEIQVSTKLSPSDIIEVIGRELKAEFIPLAEIAKGEDVAWICLDPVGRVAWYMDVLTLAFANRLVTKHIVSGFPKWCEKANTKIRDAIQFGHDLAVIKDYVTAGWKSADFEIILRALAKQGNDLGLSLDIAPLLEMIDGKEYLGQLSEVEKKLMEKFLRRIDVAFAVR